MQTNNQRPLLPPNSSTLLRPASYEEGEPLVTYIVGAAMYSVPRRAVIGGGDSFLSRQIEHDTREVDRTDPQNLKVKLEDPVFQDPCVFSLLLNYLNRVLDNPANTLRQKCMSLTDQQWALLVELERFVFQKTDRNPFWTGFTGRDFYVSGKVSTRVAPRPPYITEIDPAELRVYGPCGFTLRVNLTALTDPPITRPVSLNKGPRYGMEYPFIIDFKQAFFIPHEAIQCTIDGVPTVCEGQLLDTGCIRIQPIQDCEWFRFQVSRNPSYMHRGRVFYGEEP